MTNTASFATGGGPISVAAAAATGSGNLWLASADYFGNTVTILKTSTPTCCGAFTEGFTGNIDCDSEGKRNLADISLLIDRIYMSKTPLCCEDNGNVDGDEQASMNLADITSLINHIYLSKAPTSACD